MLGINVIYTMKPGKREAFLSEVTACGVQETIRKEDGCIQYDYFLSADDPNKLLLLEKWTSREAQAVHMTQPHMAKLSEIKERCAIDAKLELYDF